MVPRRILPGALLTCVAAAASLWVTARVPVSILLGQVGFSPPKGALEALSWNAIPSDSSPKGLVFSSQEFMAFNTERWLSRSQSPEDNLESL